jgi:hypothetical protein
MSKLAFLSAGRFREWFIIAIVWVIAFDIAFTWQASGRRTHE